MISMGTIQKLRDQNHKLALYCPSCHRWGLADLDRLVRIGRGNRSVIESRFRCKDCGEIVEKQVRPPVPVIGGSVAYISLAKG